MSEQPETDDPYQRIHTLENEVRELQHANAHLDGENQGLAETSIKLQDRIAHMELERTAFLGMAPVLQRIGFRAPHESETAALYCAKLLIEIEDARLEANDYSDRIPARCNEWMLLYAACRRRWRDLPVRPDPGSLAARIKTLK